MGNNLKRYLKIYLSFSRSDRNAILILCILILLAIIFNIIVRNIETKPSSDIDEFNNRFDLQKKMKTMFYIMLDFYGLNIYDNKVTISFENWHHKYPMWLIPRNHNFLRLSRIIRSMKLLGLKNDAQMLYDFLCILYENNENIIGPVTKQFWDEAITKDF